MIIRIREGVIMDINKKIQIFNELEKRIYELEDDGWKLRDQLFDDLNEGDYEKSLQYENAIFKLDVLLVRINKVLDFLKEYADLKNLQAMCESEKLAFDISKIIKRQLDYFFTISKRDLDALKTTDFIEYRVIEWSKELKEWYKDAIGYFEEVE